MRNLVTDEIRCVSGGLFGGLGAAAANQASKASSSAASNTCTVTTTTQTQYDIGETTAELGSSLGIRGFIGTWGDIASGEKGIQQVDTNTTTVSGAGCDENTADIIRAAQGN